MSNLSHSSDPDWNPEMETEEETGETGETEETEEETEGSEVEGSEEEEDDEEDEMDLLESAAQHPMGAGGAGPLLFITIPGIQPRKRRRGHDECCGDKHAAWSPDEEEFIKSLSLDVKERLLKAHQECSRSLPSSHKAPYRIRVLLSKANPVQKQILLQKVMQLQSMDPMAGEYHMLHHWVDSAVQLPLGIYHPLPLGSTDPSSASVFLQETRGRLDREVYGHQEAKSQILRILAQWISNPSSKGNVIGIYGGAGVGKTTLVKEGISKALGLPFAFVALGGASDGAFLEGHSYTYQGATHGRIAEILMKAGCMNPVVFMDELDKVSDTPKGQEVASILMHITDSAQNERFTDRYFGDLELDLSKALFVFSYNDPSKVNPILLDRMIQIHVHGYNQQEKRTIARDYMIPKMLQEFGLTRDQVVLSEPMLAYILEKLPKEDGVRTFKRSLECIISWINMLRFTEPERIKFPFTVDSDFVDECLAKTNYANTIPDHVLMSMYT